MSDAYAKWLGLQALVQDAVEHGSRAIERVQLESARRPFAILEHVPGVAEAARVVHAAHDVSVITTHAVVRAVNGAAGAAIAAAIEAARRH